MTPADMTPAGREPAAHDDQFAHDDAAYVLGLLSGPQRAAFEQHLAGCGECADRVAALAPTASALTGLDPSDWAVLNEPVPPVPDDVLPRLLRAVHRRRTRLRVGLAAAGAAAAAAIAALLVVLGAGGSGPPPAVAAGRVMTAVAGTPVRATAAVAETAWGTRITVDCRYAAPSAYPRAPAVYTLQAVDTSGARHRLGSWTQSGHDVEYTAGIALPESRLRAIQIALPGGAAVLTLSLR